VRRWVGNLDGGWRVVNAADGQWLAIPSIVLPTEACGARAGPRAVRLRSSRHEIGMEIGGGGRWVLLGSDADAADATCRW